MKIDYQGNLVDAEEIEPLTTDERWNNYKLPDGKWLSIKTVLVKVCRATTEKSPDGEPLYVVNTQQIVKVK